MKKVYISAFGSGMGHASRMAALAQELLASGDDVAFSSSGEVTKWFESRGFRCNDLPLVDVVFTDEGSFSAKETMKFSPRIFARFYRQVVREIGNIKRYSPAVVLSDSMASTVVAAKLLGVRSVAVLNQLRLISSPRTPRTVARLLSAGSVTVGDIFWELCDDILIPDLPPPYTISETNLWNAGRASARAKYIGFLTPARSAAASDAGSEALLQKWRAETRPRVFWQISGPPATRGPLLAKAMAAVKALGEKYLFVITAGAPRGATTPSPVPGGYLYQWCDVSPSFVGSCDVVVSRAGHVSISEYILQGKPALLVPIRAQTEQMGNADKARRLGFALTLEEDELEPSRVEESLKELMDGRHAERALELRRVARGFDAVRSIVEIVGTS